MTRYHRFSLTHAHKQTHDISYCFTNPNTELGGAVTKHRTGRGREDESYLIFFETLVSSAFTFASQQPKLIQQINNTMLENTALKFRKHF